jgi:hypothetical protein
MIAHNRWRSVRDTVKEMPVRITQIRTAPTVKESQIGFFCFDPKYSTLSHTLIDFNVLDGNFGDMRL